MRSSSPAHLPPLPQQTWKSFTRNWNVDVKSTCLWILAELAGRMSPGKFNTVRFFAGVCGVALATELFVRFAGAENARSATVGFGAALGLLAGLSVLGVFFASRLAKRQAPRTAA